MDEASPNPFERPLVANTGSVCLPEFGHNICPSTVDLELHRGEGPDIDGSSDSDSGHLDTTKSIVSHDGASRATAQTSVATFDDDDDIHEGVFHDPMLGFDELSQDLYDVYPRKELYDGLANRALNILFNGQAFTDGEVADVASGFTEAGSDKDALAIELERSVGPGRHYHQFGANFDGTQGPGAGGTRGTQPNNDPMSNMAFTPWRRPGESFSGAGEAIQPTENSGWLQDPTAGSHPQGFNTLLHCTGSVPASGPLMATVGNLMAVNGTFSTEMHEAEPAAISLLFAAMNEEERASIIMLLGVMGEEELAADFSTTGGKSPPTETYWRASPSPSSATRHTRLDEFPKGVVQRLMPRGGSIYFGMDMDSFTSARIDPGVTDCLRDAAIQAAEEITEQKLGIAFDYTTDPRYKVFNICYDPSLPVDTLAQAFFPGDRPDRWKLGVSSLASVRWVFDRNRPHIHKIFEHEFAHILGLRHYNAGSNAVELRERSFLWPGTRDGDCNTIMCTGVHSGNLEFSDEDIRVIRELYSKTNGSAVDGIRIMDVNPYMRLWDFFLYQVRRLNGSNPPRQT